MSEMTKEQAFAFSQLLVTNSDLPEHAIQDIIDAVHVYGDEHRKSERNEMAWDLYKELTALGAATGALVNGDKKMNMAPLSFERVDMFIAYRDRQNGK